MATNTVGGRVLKRAEKELAQTKVVLRHLPPDFTREKFESIIEGLPEPSFHYFIPGNPLLGECGCARGYIDLSRNVDLVVFRDKYDGSTLESEKGLKYRLIVELAPYQGVPKAKYKADIRCGTIEQDQDYKTFFNEYIVAAEPLPPVDLSYLEEVENSKVAEIQATPLVDFLKIRKAASKTTKSSKKVVLYADAKRKRSDKAKSNDITKSKTKESHSKDDGSKDDIGKKSDKISRNDEKPTVIIHGSGRNKRNESVATKQPSYTEVGKREKQFDSHGSSDQVIKDKRKSKDRPDQQYYSPRSGRQRGESWKDSKVDKANKYSGSRNSKSSRSREEGHTYHFEDADDGYEGPDYHGKGTGHGRGQGRKDDYQYNSRGHDYTSRKQWSSK